MAGFAVLVGINGFQHFPNATLRYCENDALGLGDLLGDNSMLVQQFETIETRVGEEASRNSVMDTIDNVFSRAGKNDQIWLFIASHGYRRDNKNYILMQDTLSGSNALKDGTCLKLDDIRALMAASRAPEKIVMLDCCHASSADFIQRAIGEEAFSFRTARSLFSDDETFAFFNACKEGEVAYEDDDLKHGVWSHFLLEALRGARDAWTADNILTTESLQRYLRIWVSRHVKNVFDKSQTPDCEMKSTSGSLVIGSQGASEPRAKRATKKAKSEKSIIKEGARTIDILREDLKQPLMDLGQEAAYSSLARLADQWDVLRKQQVSSPIAMLGHIGCGKTSLLNAICGQQIGFAGGGSARSAVSLIVQHAQGPFAVTVRYLDIGEIQDLLTLDVDETTDFVDLLSSEQTPELNPVQRDRLAMVLRDPDKVFADSLEPSDLLPELEDAVRLGETTKYFGRDETEHMLEYLLKHIDSSGSCWQITREVAVSGELPGLSPGMLIMDLPGFGDMDPLRLHKAKTSLRSVQQVVVVTDHRGIDADIQETLIDIGLVTAVLTSPNIEQVIFAGTKIDRGSVSPSDQKKLSLPDDYSPRQAVEAQFQQWDQTVRAQWSMILRQEIHRTKDVAHKDAGTVLRKTRFIPTSPEGFLCLCGIQRDPTGAYAKAFGSPKGTRIAEVTGVSHLRSALRDLIDVANELRQAKLTRLHNQLRKNTFAICSSLIEALSSDIELSKDDSRAVDNIARDAVAALKHKSTRVGIPDEVLKTHMERLDAVKTIVADCWQGMNAENMRRGLASKYGKTNFMVLYASMRRKGIYTSQGRDPICVNIPELVGQTARTRLTGFTNEDLLSGFESAVREAVTESLDRLTVEFLQPLRSKQSTSTMFDAECAAIVGQYSDEVQLYLDSWSDEVRSLKADISRLADLSIGEGFESVMTVAREESKGKGARRTMIEKLAELAEQMRIDICRRTAQHYTILIEGKLEGLAADFERQMLTLRGIAEERISEAKRRILTEIEATEKARLTKVLGAALKRL